MTTVHIYVSPNTDTTTALMSFIAKNIDEINKKVTIKRVVVNKNNVKQLKAAGITSTPTLVYKDKMVVGVQKIMSMLKPPTAQQDNYGSFASPEAMVQKYMQNAMRPDDDEEEEDTNDRMRQRMEAFQNRRATMIGGDKHPDTRKAVVAGGKNKKRPEVKTFASDEEFVGSMNMGEETPTEVNYIEDDGDLILENERNDEADRQGRKVGRTISRRR